MNYRVFETPNEIIKNIMSYIQQVSHIKENVNVALLGGSTIDYIVNYLNENKKLDLKNITFFMGDERLVPSGSPENNTNNFLKNLKKKVQVVKIDTALPKDEMKKKYLNDLKVHGAHTFFDFMILGVGEDGHTLSVFPKDLENDLKSTEIVDFYVRESDGQERLGFTIPFASKAEHLFFVAIGKSKSEIVGDIYNNKNKNVPVGAILLDNNESVLYCDTESAQLLMQ